MSCRPGWLAIVLALFAFPLSAFTRTLAQFKRRSLLLLGAQATLYNRAVERKTIGRNVFADGEEPERGDSDPTKLFETAGKLSTVLFKRSAVIPVTAAAHSVRMCRSDQIAVQGGLFGAEKAAADLIADNIKVTFGG